LYQLLYNDILGIDFKIKTLEVEGKKVKMQIWDTAGQEKFRSIIQGYYKGAMGIIVVYSCSDRKSFANVESWMRQIKTHAVPDVCIILVGNKCDLANREVKKEEGEELAKSYKVKFFETSAKEGLNVSEVFLEIAKTITKKINEDPSFKQRLEDVNSGGTKLRLDSVYQNGRPSGISPSKENGLNNGGDPKSQGNCSC
jgi:small GTP-binding protein